MLKTIVGKKGKKRAKICQKLPECFKIAEDMCSLEYNLSIFNLQKPFRKYFTNLISNLCDCYPCSSPKPMRMYSYLAWNLSGSLWYTRYVVR